MVEPPVVILKVGAMVKPEREVTAHAFTERESRELVSQDEQVVAAVLWYSILISKNAVLEIVGYIPTEGGYYLVKGKRSSDALENDMIENQLFAIPQYQWNMKEVVAS